MTTLTEAQELKNIRLIAKAKAQIEVQSTALLCEMFELTNNNNEAGVFNVRGWVMDELEQRDPKAFEAWMETEDVALMDFPSKFYS